MKNLYFTIINEGYIPFTINFLKRLKEVEFQEEFLIACIDTESFHFLKNIHENVIEYNLNLSREFEKWQSEKYKEIVFSKLDIKKSIIEKNKDVYDNIIFIDTDIWINKNFSDELNSILENNDYDIIFQDGEDYLFYKDECFELLENKLIQKRYCNSFCTGFMVMNSKSSEKILNFLNYKEEEKKKCNGNQQYLNEKLYFENLKTLTIPKKLFPNYSICNFYKKYDYWMLHYTYLKGKEKINAMKKNNHWIVDQLPNRKNNENNKTQR